MTSPLFQPPRNFRSAETVQWAELRQRGPWQTNLPPPVRTAAQRSGQRYERRAHQALSARFSPERGTLLYAPAMWIAYSVSGEGKLHWAQPDGLLIDLKRGLITVLEIKIRHTTDAWWQLRKLYEPLIRKLFGSAWRYAVCEVVRWYDPVVRWPEQLVFSADPGGLPANSFGLHILGDARVAELGRGA
jgi:hypothetical protein